MVIEFFSCATSAHVCGFVAKLTIDPVPVPLRPARCGPCQDRSAARRYLPLTKLRRKGVTHVFHAGKRGNHQRQRRGHFALLPRFFPPVFIDIESLPTGMSGRCGQSSFPPLASWPNRHLRQMTGCRHPVSGSLMRLIMPIRVAAMLVNASPTARRAEAAKSSSATGARSPIDIASP